MGSKQQANGTTRRRRAKIKGDDGNKSSAKTSSHSSTMIHSRARANAKKESSIIMTLLPSLLGLFVLAVVVMGKMGFRGRVTVAGVDLGTTNSVVCIQALSKSVGEIECIPDPTTGSAIIPSVVSLVTDSAADQEDFPPVVVGTAAKARITTHPHNTLYHAKRVIGRDAQDEAVGQLRQEVEFEILNHDDVTFRVPPGWTLTPPKVGSFIVRHLMEMTAQFLGHSQVKSAVIAIPAKFDPSQRDATVQAFSSAGVKVTRILEEPTAAALAYGLDKKPNVRYIMVYDFGGGTLDVSILFVADDGFVDVMGVDGDNELGGADFDAAIAHYFEKSYPTAVAGLTEAFHALAAQRSDMKDSAMEDVLSQHCSSLKGASAVPLCTMSSLHTIGEELKIQLSNLQSQGGDSGDPVTVEGACHTIAGDTSQPIGSLSDLCGRLETVSLSLTSEEYHKIAQPLFDRALLPIRRVMSSLDLTSADIDEVVMVGGTTRMPHIRTLVKEELEVAELNTAIDPDLTVAYGAASVID